MLEARATPHARLASCFACRGTRHPVPRGAPASDSEIEGAAVALHVHCAPLAVLLAFPDLTKAGAGMSLTAETSAPHAWPIKRRSANAVAPRVTPRVPSTCGLKHRVVTMATQVSEGVRFHWRARAGHDMHDLFGAWWHDMSQRGRGPPVRSRLQTTRRGSLPAPQQGAFALCMLTCRACSACSAMTAPRPWPPASALDDGDAHAPRPARRRWPSRPCPPSPLMARRRARRACARRPSCS